jgi:hypothetical protein
MVAGVMIGSGALAKGVAPSAPLFASAAAPMLGDTPEQQMRDMLITMQHVATRNANNIDANGDVRAINYSGQIDAPDLNRDGMSTITLGVDWSATAHNVLYVKARGNTVPLTQNFPVDNFNGMNVAATQSDANLTFTTLWNGNDFRNALDGRRLTSIVAPGVQILVPLVGGNTYVLGDGTSFAAPHVTAAVALLQQYADDRIAANAAGWDADSRRHEVMKAVMMNSADKIKNPKDGPYIQMQKTIVKTDSTTWLQSDARDSPDNQAGRQLPLDNEMGTGQLNVGRAVRQFASGRVLPPGPGGTVPIIGWDYNSVVTQGQVNKYPLQNLGEGYISITLVWDRIVDLTDAIPNGKYDPGEPLTARDLPDLDLYLMPAGATDFSQNIWSSNSAVYNVEHIFFQLDRSRPVEIWVLQHSAMGADYALAWWGTQFQGAMAPSATNLDGASIFAFGTLLGVRPPTAQPGVAAGAMSHLPRESSAFSEPATVTGGTTEPSWTVETALSDEFRLWRRYSANDAHLDSPRTADHAASVLDFGAFWEKQPE